MDEIDVLNEQTKEPTEGYIGHEQLLKRIEEQNALIDNLLKGQVKTIQLINKLIDTIEKIEKQANEMTSPDALMNMAQSLMPNMLNGGGFGG